MRGKLTPIASNHDHVRKNSLIGVFDHQPVVGKGFIIRGGMRIITTTAVRSIQKLDEKLFKFKTDNSIYGLEILD